MAKTVRQTIQALFLMCVFLFIQSASAGTLLEDFKEAERNLANDEKPCLTIPYSDLRDECLKKRDAVQNQCKTVQWSCTGDHDIKDILININKKNKGIESLKGENDKSNDRLREAKEDNEKSILNKMIKDNEEAMYQANREVEDLTRQLNDRKENLQKRIEFAETCVSYRTEAQKVFESVISRAKGESDDNIRPIAQKLLAKWEPDVREHDGQKDQVKRGIQTCKDMKDRRSEDFR
jgi:hypothetical protein